MSPATIAAGRTATPAGPQWWEGYPLAESIHTTVTAIESGNWVDREIGSLSASLDLLAITIDPIAMLGAWAVDWVIEHTPILRQKLTQLTGDPQRITTHAETWRHIATTCHQQATQLPHHLTDITDWTGTAATTYRQHANATPDILAATAQAALGIAAATELGGRLIATVRTLIRELIAQLVARLAIWAAAEGASLGLLTPLIAGQSIPFIANLTSRALTLTEAMTRSITNLKTLTTKLTHHLTELEHTATARSLRTAGAVSPAEAELAIRSQLLDEARKVYPGWKAASPYDANCANCVVAFEMRRRGLDAVAQPLSEADVFLHGSRPPGVIEKLFGRSFVKASQSEIEQAFQGFGPGSRGIVYVKWNNASAHVFNVENVKGHITWIEPQTGELDVGRYFDKGEYSKYVRVDDAAYSAAEAKTFARVKPRWSR